MAVPGHKPSIDAALQVTVSDIAAKARGSECSERSITAAVSKQVLGVFHLKDDCQARP